MYLSNRNMKKFKVQLEIIQELFNQIFVLTASIEDGYRREKYKGAARTLLKRLEELV